MSASRTWNLRLNLDEFNALAASVYTDADRALLFQGMTLGFNGGDCPGETPAAFSRAHQFGMDSRQEAEAFRVKMGANGSRGGRPAHRQDPGEHEPDQGMEEPTGKPEGNQQVNQLVYQQGNQTSTQSTIHNPTNEKQQTTDPQPKARAPRFVPPSEDEWVAYCVETWSDWHPWSAAQAHARYASVGWMSGKTPLKDWKGAAKTAHGNAVQWGTLQPKPANGYRQSPPSPRAGWSLPTC